MPTDPTARDHRPQPAGDADALSVWRWLRMFAAWVVLLGALALLAVMVVVPRVAGARPYAVLSGSMSPTFEAGDLVVVRPTDPGRIGVGSVITYQQRSGERSTVTHRVRAVRLGPDGDVSFVTQGDANNTADRDPVRPEQVRGTLWYQVPYLGHLHTLLSGRQHQLLVRIAAAALIAYAVAMFAGAVRDHLGRHSRSGEIGERSGDTRDRHVRRSESSAVMERAPVGDRGEPADLVGAEP